MTERIFTADDMSPIPIRHGPGMLTAWSGLMNPTRPISPDSTDWEPTNSLEEVIAARRRIGLSAIAAVANRDTIPVDRLALTFSGYLRHIRQARFGMPVTPCITSTDRFLTPPTYVRIPHLVAYDTSQHIQDTVIWELQAEQDAEEWLGNALPEQGRIEAVLPRILMIRKAIREAKVMEGEAIHEIKERLGTDRYLSILFVYQNPDLFRSA